MLQNSKFAAFTVSEFLRENQQGKEVNYSPPPTQIRFKLKAQQGRCVHQVDSKTPNPGTLNHNCFKVFSQFFESRRYDMDTEKILLHFNFLLQQNVTQFSQNPPIH